MARMLKRLTKKEGVTELLFELKEGVTTTTIEE